MINESLYKGVRVNSKRRLKTQSEVDILDSKSASTYYEATITMLFLPWIIDEIPDGKWQTLLKNLRIIIGEMLSGNNQTNREVNK